MLDKFFSIEYPVLKEIEEGVMIAAACATNTNYYTSGGNRSNCRSIGTSRCQVVTGKRLKTWPTI